MEMIERLLEILAQKGMKQGELERLAGLSANRISKWKDGQGEPTARQLFKICKILGVSPTWLVEGTEAESSASGDEAYVIRLMRDLDFEPKQAAQVLARSFAFRGWKPGDVVTDELLVPEQPAGPRELKQGRRKV